VAIVTPEHYGPGTKGFGIGIGVSAYTLGMRHAFDADHIAAIDNTTRKLMDEGRRPLPVGFWFSPGHSSVVYVLALLLSLDVKSLAAPVREDNSELHHVTELIGTTVSGFAKRANLFGDRNLRVDPVHLQKADALGPEPVQALLDLLSQALRPYVVRPPFRPGLGDPNLGGDQQVVRVWTQGLGQEFLVGAPSVHAGGVDQGNAQLDGAPG
jgi:hypothetical protein